VEDMPSFDELWPLISAKLRGVKFIAAHNAPFDRSVLCGCCEHYGLIAPSVPFVCLPAVVVCYPSSEVSMGGGVRRRAYSLPEKPGISIPQNCPMYADF